MASIPMIGERFEMGRVMSRTFGTIGRNAGLLLGLVVVLYMLPSLLLQLTLMAPQAAMSQAALPQARVAAMFAAFASPTYWLGLLVSVFLYFFMQAAVTYISVVDLDGRRPQLQPALTTALSCALPLFGLGILLTLGCYLGLLLLIVPGLILFTMWSVAGVVLVAERPGVFASFGRSSMLTKGYRWPIFGLMVIVILIYLACSMLVGLISFFVMHSAGTLGVPGIGAMILGTLGGAVLTLLFTVGFASIYAELRTVKEGASGASLANIFA